MPNIEGSPRGMTLSTRQDSHISNSASVAPRGRVSTANLRAGTVVLAAGLGALGALGAEAAYARPPDRTPFTNSQAECKAQGWVGAESRSPQSISVQITASRQCHSASGNNAGFVRAWVHDFRNGLNYGSSGYQSFVDDTGTLTFGGASVKAYAKLAPNPPNRHWHETSANSYRNP
jgi:hypothetical protein